MIKCDILWYTQHFSQDHRRTSPGVPLSKTLRTFELSKRLLKSISLLPFKLVAASLTFSNMPPSLSPRPFRNDVKSFDGFLSSSLLHFECPALAIKQTKVVVSLLGPKLFPNIIKLFYTWMTF